MIIEKTIELAGDVYWVQVGLAPIQGKKPLTEAESEKLAQFGEPTIECGGQFIMEGDSTFDLPTRQLLFPSQFPVRQSFSIPDIAGNEANVQATTWRDAIEGRITTAMQALSSIDAGILGTTITEIDTNA